MEFNFSLTRILTLAALVAAFALWGGFTFPTEAPDALIDPSRMRRAWLYCILLFLSGSICASLVDHYVGDFPRSSLRIIYIFIGCVLMGGGFLWQKTMRHYGGGEAPIVASPVQFPDALVTIEWDGEDTKGSVEAKASTWNLSSGAADENWKQRSSSAANGYLVRWRGHYGAGDRYEFEITENTNEATEPKLLSVELTAGDHTIHDGGAIAVTISSGPQSL